MNDYTNLTIEQINTELNNLTFLTDSIILSATDVAKHKEALMNAKDKKILETYPIRIWQTNVGTWKAHVPDPTKDRGRRNIEGKTQEHLEKNILKDYHKRFDDKLVFANYFVNWLFNYKAKDISSPTLQRYYDEYKKHIKGTSFDKMRITEIRRIDIKDFLNDVINKNHLTRHAVSNLKTVLNGVFEHAFDRNEITSNPAISLKITNSNMKPDRDNNTDDDVDEATQVFDEDEFEPFVKYLYEHYTEHRPFVTLAILLNFQMGLRVGELCTLKKSDVNFRKSKILIQRMERSYKKLTLIDGKVIEGSTVHEVIEGDTKCHSNRFLELSDEALAIIRRTLELHKELGITSDYLFPDENGNHLIRQRFNDCLRYYCNQLSFINKSSHKVRKTVFSNLFTKGFDIEEVMKIAGHKHKTTTLKYYLFSTKGKKTKRERINEALNSNHCPFSSPTPHPSMRA